ncbi:MAG: 3-hydroxyacyl-ACP dehydratase FabZ family protein [Planctomycetota bacterium]
MKFHLVDRIELLEPSQRIVTTKVLSLAEEYLADHFPTFPVMPGVLMLEALTQSAAWLTRVEQNFSRSMIVLATARNVRYARFVEPGQTFRCEVTAREIGSDIAKFSGNGYVGEQQAVAARLELRCFNLAEEHDYLADADREIVADLKERFRLIGGPQAMNAGEKAANR